MISNSYNAAYQQAINAYTNAGNATPKAPANDGAGFSGLVGEALQSVASSLHKGENITTRSLVKEADMGDVVTAVSEAEVALQSIVAIRDRAIAAYQDILKMPI